MDANVVNSMWNFYPQFYWSICEVITFLKRMQSSSLKFINHPSIRPFVHASIRPSFLQFPYVWKPEEEIQKLGKLSPWLSRKLLVRLKSTFRHSYGEHSKPRSCFWKSEEVILLVFELLLKNTSYIRRENQS